MTKKQIKRENIIIAVGFVLAFVMIATAVILTSILSRNLNRFLFAENNLSEEAPIKFNFEAYNALEL